MTLECNTVPELKAMAKELGLKGYSKLTKLELMRLLERAQGKASKSTVIKKIAKEQGVEVIDVPMTLESDWEDMQGVPMVEVDGDACQNAPVTDLVGHPDWFEGDGIVPADVTLLAEGKRDGARTSPKSSDEVWEEATAIAEEVLEQPKGSMLVMNRHARRRAKALLRRKMKQRVA